jgi:hypothetical protein
MYDLKRNVFAFFVSVHAPNKAAVNSPVKSSAPTGPARSVLPVHDEPARGRWGDSKRIAPGSVPLLRDELAAVETKGQYPGEHLPFFNAAIRRCYDIADECTDSC